MLFGRETEYDLPLLKHIAEIVVGNDDFKLCSKLQSVSAGKISSTLEEHGVEVYSPLEQLKEFMKLQGKNEDYIKQFDQRLTRFLVKFRDYELPAEYCKINSVGEKLRKRLESNLNKRARQVIEISDPDWSQISNDFVVYVREYCSNYSYDPATEDNLIGFLMNAMNFYILSKMLWIYGVVNQRGINKNFDGEDYSVVDRMAEDVVLDRDLPNFGAIAQDIYNVSALVYTHSGEITYDVFSRYKKQHATKKFDSIKSLLKNSFSVSGLYRTPEFIDINFKLEGGRSEDAILYAKEKQRHREPFMSILDEIVQDAVGPEDLGNLIDRLKDYNTKLAEKTNGKNSLYLFTTGKFNVKGRLDTNARIKQMLFGMASLKKLINYCDEMGINIFTVKSDIFKTEGLLRRFRSFKEYYDPELYETIVSLMQENTGGSSSTLISNDDVYESVCDAVWEKEKSKIKDVSFGVLRGALCSLKGKRPVKDIAVPVVDLSMLTEEYKKFKDAEQAKELTFARKFAVSLKIFKTLKGVYENKFVPQGSGYYEIDEGFDLKALLDSKYPGMYESYVAEFIYPFRTKGEQALCLSRSMFLVIYFLKYVESVVKLLQPFAQSTEDLNLYTAVSKNLEMFTMPKFAKNQEEFAWFQDHFNIEPFIPKGQDISDVGPHMVMIYNKVSKEFSGMLEYLDEIYSSLYLPLNDSLGLVKQYPYDVPVSWLRDVGWLMYNRSVSATANNVNFKRFVGRCKIDDYGFLIRNNKIYKKDLRGSTCYLHQKGYWVSYPYELFGTIPVGEDEVFE